VGTSTSHNPIGLHGLLQGQIYLYLNPLNTEFVRNFIYEFSLYLTGNTLRLRYKAQPVNAVWGKVTVYCENHTEHTDTLCGQNAEFWYVKEGGIYSNLRVNLLLHHYHYHYHHYHQ
jgi:hypothetical protein